MPYSLKLKEKKEKLADMECRFCHEKGHQLHQCPVLEEKNKYAICDYCGEAHQTRRCDNAYIIH